MEKYGQQITWDNHRIFVRWYMSPDEAFRDAFCLAIQAGLMRPKWWQFWLSREKAYFTRADALERG